jgi:hypothetical protein
MFLSSDMKPSDSEGVGRESWVWVESIFGAVSPIPYPVFSIFIGLIALIIFIKFTQEVAFFEFRSFFILILVTVLLLSYLLAGIQYVLNDSRETFKIADQLNAPPEPGLYSVLEKKFYKSVSYYVIIAIFIFILSVIDVISYLQDPTILFSTDPSSNGWYAALDIYNFSISYLITILLATVVWIFYTISSALDKASDELYKLPPGKGIISDIGQRKLKGLLLRVSLYYFIAVSLTIISTISPGSFYIPEEPLPIELALETVLTDVLYSLQVVLTAVLIISGAVLFFMGLGAVRRLSNAGIDKEIAAIDALITGKSQLLLDAASGVGVLDMGDRDDENAKLDSEKAEYISSMLSLLRSEKDYLIKSRRKGYDLSTITAFLTTSLIPLATAIQSFRSIPLAEDFIHILNNLR